MAQKRPTISILLPAFNAENYLDACLKSIADQRFCDYELIAIDDGSHDRTGRILSEFAHLDPRFKIHHLAQNCGIVHALNHGLSLCRGQWVARMDADDLMLPERLEKQLHFFQTQPGSDLIGAQVSLFREDRTLTDGQLHYIEWSNSLLSDQDMKRAIFTESPMMHPTFFAPLHFFRELGGYRDRPWPEDYDLLLRAFTSGAVFAKVPEILVNKRDSPDRLYRKDPRGKPDGMFRAKAHFFVANAQSHQKGKCFIAGTGSSGRTAARHLLAEGSRLDGFIDHIDGPPARTIMGLPVTNWMGPEASEFFHRNHNALFILCIGNRQGRQSLIELLDSKQFKQGHQVVRFL